MNVLRRKDQMENRHEESEMVRSMSNYRMKTLRVVNNDD